MPAPFDGDPGKFFIPLLGSLVAFGPMSIDMYLPALPTITQDLGATQAQVQHSLSAFFSGFCIAMLIYGPISDVIGRRKLLIVGLMIFVISSVLLAFAPNAQLFILLRFTQAFGSAAAIVMARAIARDAYHPGSLTKVLSLMSLVTMIAPLLAPVVGGYLLYFFGWRSIFYALAVIGFTAFSVVLYVLPETIKEQDGDASIFKTSIKNYLALLTSPDAMGIIGVFAFSFGAMFAFIAGSPFVYIKYFGIEDHYYGFLFLLNIVGMIVMVLINMRLINHFSLNKLILFLSSFQLAAGAALFLLNDSNIYIVVTCVVLFISMVNAIGTNALALLLQHRGNMAGSASALAISIQFAAGCLSSYLVSVLQDDSPYAMTLIMFIFAALSFVHQFMIRKTSPDPK